MDTLVVITGAGGTGKSTLAKNLVESKQLIRAFGGHIKLIPTVTTRPMRSYEKLTGDGYIFVENGEFHSFNRNGDLVLVEEYNNWKFGVFKSDITDVFDNSTARNRLRIMVTTKSNLPYLINLCSNDIMEGRTRILQYRLYCNPYDRLIRMLERCDNRKEANRRYDADAESERGFSILEYRAMFNTSMFTPESLAKIIESDILHGGSENG